MKILGIGGIGGDAAAVALNDGVVTAAIEESKLVRGQNHGGLPMEAIGACLRLSRLKAEQIDSVALVRPGAAAGIHLALRNHFPQSRIALVEHHTAHAASAFFASPFSDATVVTLDRAGDLRCGARWRGEGRHLTLESEFFYPDSLGDLYGRVTELLGFRSQADEHKVQWMGAAGDGQFVDLFREVIGASTSGLRFDRGFFDAGRLSHGGFSANFYRRLGLKDLQAVPDELKPHVAAGAQRAIEQVVIEFATAGSHTAKNVCLAGGLGMNALLVAALENSGKFEGVFVQPAAGNSGSALGAVLYTWHEMLGRNERAVIENYCLGPSYTAEEIKQVVENCKLRFRYLLTGDELIDAAVERLSENRIVAWMQGRMEFGPRALGNRSILASPLDPYSTENLNTFIKHREGFRKFAASVPAEVAGEYFETGPNARFLATVGNVRRAHRETFAGALLSGDLIRVHVVSREDNPLYWKLLNHAGQKTGLPVLYNTSFNLFGEPLVCTPRDAVRSFYSSGIDAMFCGHFLLQK
ncbi:MAG TPA: carbamoyltransferase C-terminal domain-containing protein [Bryobacteraceae bacterium]|jgi:carbamoyltransferase